MIFARGRRWAEVRLARCSDRAGDVRSCAGSTCGRASTSGCRRAARHAVGRRRKRAAAGSSSRTPTSSAIDIRASRADAARKRTAAGDRDADILARYPDVAGVPAGRLRQACATACARVGGERRRWRAGDRRGRGGLPALAATLAQLHAPPPRRRADELAAMNRGDSAWHRRLAFGELFALGVAVAMRRRERRGDAAVPCARARRARRGRCTKALPFAPTGAQRPRDRRDRRRPRARRCR